MVSVEIRSATPADINDVCELVTALLAAVAPGNRSFEQLLPVTAHVLRHCDDVYPFVAIADGKTVGVIILNKCCAIYAMGDFGEISELFVAPEMRSANIGAKLIAKAVEFGISKGWSKLEVGAPDVPKWQRTVDFYQNNGFKEIGPRLYLPIG